MASDFFRILRGLIIDESVNIITAQGSPTSADTISCPEGSLYLQTDTAQVWLKFQTTTNTVADWEVLATNNYVTNAINTAIAGITPPATVSGKSTNITSAILDSTTAQAIKYLVHVEETGSPANARVYEIFIAQSGGSTDITQYATLVFGTAPPGLQFTATQVGGTILQLNVAASSPVDVRWTRVSVLNIT